MQKNIFNNKLVCKKNEISRQVASFFESGEGRLIQNLHPPPQKKTPPKIPIFKIIIRRGVWTSIFLSFTACSQKMEEASSKIQMWMKAGWGDATWVVRIRNNSKLKKNTGIAQIHDLTCNLFMSTCYFFYLLTCKIITRMPKVCNFFSFSLYISLKTRLNLNLFFVWFFFGVRFWSNLK